MFFKMAFINFSPIFRHTQERLVCYQIYEIYQIHWILGGGLRIWMKSTYIHETVEARPVFYCQFFAGTGLVFFDFVVFRYFFVTET